MAWNFFDYVDNSVIWLKNFVMATTLIRKSDTWVGENRFYVICMLNDVYDELYYLTFNDIEEFIKASRKIYIKLIEKELSSSEINIAVAVIPEDKKRLYKNKRLKSINNFVDKYIKEVVKNGWWIWWLCIKLLIGRTSR